jgi:hypothetical protein
MTKLIFSESPQAIIKTGRNGKIPKPAGLTVDEVLFTR